MGVKFGFSKEETKELKDFFSFSKAWVYSLNCKANEKRYIGSSRMVERRIRSHLSALMSGRHPNEDLQKDFDKYGAEQFDVEVLGMTGEGLDRGKCEKEWQYKFKTYDRSKGYNYKDPHFFACCGGSRWEKFN